MRCDIYCDVYMKFVMFGPQIIQYHHPSDCSLLCCCGHLTSDYSAPDTKKNQEPDADDDD